MSRTQPWSAVKHIIDGVFATTEDLEAALDGLREATGGPVIAAAFSGRWLVRSLSSARAEDEHWAVDVVGALEAQCREHLDDQQDKVGFVESCVVRALRSAGVVDASTLAFGGGLDRPGGIAVVVGGTGLASAELGDRAEHVAACVLGSRPAAFSLDTSLELAVLSELRQAGERSRPSSPSLVDVSREDTVDSLLRFAAAIVRTHSIVTYEANHAHSQRFTHLDRRSFDPPDGTLPKWMPSRVTLSEDLEIPAPPELGGSEFDSLAPFVDHCFASKGKPRRLVGLIAERYLTWGIPYGFDDLRRRPIGILCLVWRAEAETLLGPYEVAASRMIASHLARIYDTRHSSLAVGLVTGQLSAISNDPHGPGATDALTCDPIFTVRRDVRQIAPAVGEILEGLVNLSGAMSATCRLLSGTEGPSFTRSLVRLHSGGEVGAARAPHRITLDKAHESVNAWVATRGAPVYLRTLVPDEAPDCYTSPDLASYPGLDRVAIYRDEIQSELCVPIFAERRVVGTVNLEAGDPYAFDSVAETVREYAQLIGVALLESRRRIGVDTVTEVDGVLTYRHQLEAELEELAEGDVAEVAVQGYQIAIERVKSRVFAKRLVTAQEFGPDARVNDAISAGMLSLKWATRHTDISELVVEPLSDAAAEIYNAQIDGDAARALAFAVAQALHNVRKYGGSWDALAERQYSAMFRFDEMVLGGVRTLFVAVSSTAGPDAFSGIDPQQVFREPIERADRVSIGAFLAGEALRRCGGSAYLRLSPGISGSFLVDAEFSVPAIRS